MAMLGLVPLGANKITKANQDSRSSELAASRAEQLLVTPYDDALLDSGTHADDANPVEDGIYITWEVEDDQPIASCKRITVYARPGSTTATPVARVVIVTPRVGG
jgi:hypothetical protein